jgi:UDP-N-acetylglucosamine 2-epimerase (non-hydrolysing)
VVYDRLNSISRIFLLNPLPYPGFLSLLKKSFCVLTDSGGVQEEAPFFGKPVLIMRDVTERPEAISAGTARLVGSSLDSILTNINDLIQNKQSYRGMSKRLNLFGDGKACIRIVDSLKYHFNISKLRPEDFKSCS